MANQIKIIHFCYHLNFLFSHQIYMLDESQNNQFFASQCDSSSKFISSLISGHVPAQPTINILVIGESSGGKTFTIRSLIRAYRRQTKNSKKIYGERLGLLVKYPLEPIKYRNYIIEGHEWNYTKREVVFYELPYRQECYVDEVKRLLAPNPQQNNCIRIPGLDSSVYFQGIIICSNLTKQGGVESRLVAAAIQSGIPYWLVMTNLGQFQSEFRNEYEYLTCLENIIKGIFGGSIREIKNDGYYCIQNVSSEDQTEETKYYALNLLRLVLKQACSRTLTKVKPVCWGWGYFC